MIYNARIQRYDIRKRNDTEKGITWRWSRIYLNKPLEQWLTEGSRGGRGNRKSLKILRRKKAF